MIFKHRITSHTDGEYYSETRLLFGRGEHCSVEYGTCGAELSYYPRDPTELRAIGAGFMKAADELEAKQAEVATANDTPVSATETAA